MVAQRPIKNSPAIAAAYQYSVVCFADFGVKLYPINKLDRRFFDNLLDAFCG